MENELSVIERFNRSEKINMRQRTLGTLRSVPENKTNCRCVGLAIFHKKKKTPACFKGKFQNNQPLINSFPPIKTETSHMYYLAWEKEKSL